MTQTMGRVSRTRCGWGSGIALQGMGGALGLGVGGALEMQGVGGALGVGGL